MFLCSDCWVSSAPKQKVSFCPFSSCPLSLFMEELNLYQTSEAKGNVYVPVPVLRCSLNLGCV